MKYTWLNKKDNNSKLIIFFNGWGMDENAVTHLKCEDFDVIEFDDYNNLDTDILFKNYSEKHIICWSMGVMIAGVNNENIRKIIDGYNSATALCSTPYPINNNYGIPEKIYDLTISGFNETSCKRFIDRMFAGIKNTENNFINYKMTKRGLSNLKSELVELKKYKFEKLSYTKVIIPQNDVIVPTKNQIKYWETNSNIEIEFIKTGHYPFYLYNSWVEIL